MRIHHCFLPTLYDPYVAQAFDAVLPFPEVVTLDETPYASKLQIE